MKSKKLLSPGLPVSGASWSGLFALTLGFSIPAQAEETAPIEANTAPSPEAAPAPEPTPKESEAPVAGTEESVPAPSPTESPEPVRAPPADRAVRGEARVLTPVAPVIVSEPPAADPNSLPFTYHQKHIDVQLAVGPGWLTDSGVEPYSSSGAVPLVGMRIGGAPLTLGRFAFALLAEGTYGSVNGNVRGSRSSLELGLLGVGLEARYHFQHFMYAFARLSPGAGFAQTSLADGGMSLSGDGWAPTFAGHLGLAARVVGPADGSLRAPRVWLLLEGGYRYSGNYALTLRAPDDSAANAAELSMPPFSLVGPDASVAVMLTF